MRLSVGARGSPLSRAQLAEVQAELTQKGLDIQLDPIFITTVGDRDQTTSLHSLDKTDFFTRDIDQEQLKGNCRIAIHSAKDLPEALPKGLTLAALTKGVDPSDSLVLRKGTKLSARLRIAASSQRRYDAVAKLQPDCIFCDVRGNIGKRLELLNEGHFDGVVMAEAALKRLNLDPYRIPLPGPTAPLQGQLAIVARSEDVQARLAFLALDARRKRRILYLGLNPEQYKRTVPQAEVYHYPLIAITPRKGGDIAACLAQFSSITHVIFTSKTAVDLFLPLVDDLHKKRLISVGAVTTAHLHKQGLTVVHTAQSETAEGLVEVLAQENLQQAFCLWPHGALSRRLIADYFMVHDYRLAECILYDTTAHTPFPLSSFAHLDEIVFTSPSTVDSFLATFGSLPDHLQVTTQGPITRRYLEKYEIRVDYQLGI